MTRVGRMLQAVTDDNKVAIGNKRHKRLQKVTGGNKW